MPNNENKRREKMHYSNVVAWRVVTQPSPLNDTTERLRVLATFPDGTSRYLQATFRDREQLDRYIARFLPHFEGRELPQTVLPVPVAADLTEDQHGFLSFLRDLSDSQLRETFRSYAVLAGFGAAGDIWKRDECRTELSRRGLGAPDVTGDEGTEGVLDPAR